MTDILEISHEYNEEKQDCCFICTDEVARRWVCGFKTETSNEFLASLTVRIFTQKAPEVSQVLYFDFEKEVALFLNKVANFLNYEIPITQESVLAEIKNAIEKSRANYGY